MAHGGAYWFGPADRETFLGGSYSDANRGHPEFDNVWILSEDRFNIGAFPAGSNPIYNAPFDDGPGGLDTDSPFNDASGHALTYRAVYQALGAMGAAAFDSTGTVEGSGIMVSGIGVDGGYTYFSAYFLGNDFGPTIVHPPAGGGGDPVGGPAGGPAPTGGDGPSSDPGPGGGGDPGGPPTQPPGVPIPAPPDIPEQPPMTLTVPDVVPPADVITDIPDWDVVETPDDGNDGEGGGGGGQQVTWQPVPTNQQADRPNAIFAWDVPPRNLKDIDVLDDGDATVNELLGTGTLLPEDARWQGDWSASVRYKSSQYVSRDDTFFDGVHSVLYQVRGAPSIGEDPNDGGDDWDVIGIVTGGGHWPTGEWSAVHTYVSGDYVSHNNNLWITHTSGNLNEEPGVKSWMWTSLDVVGGALNYTGRDETSIALIGRYWGTENFPFANNIATLKLMVDARLKKFRMGAHIITFTPNGLSASLPKPWAEFNVGDTVRVRASWHLRGGIPKNLTGPFGRPLEVQRVNGFDLELDDGTDAERMTKVYTEEDLG